MSTKQEKGGQALAERKNGAVAPTYDYGEDAGAGFQNQSQDDVALPFIDILQPGSPEVMQEGKGARPGMIINRVTGEVWEGAQRGILLIPAITEHCFTEWKPKKGPSGETLPGGFVGRHELTEDIVKRAREESPFDTFRMPNGNDLQETFYVFGPQVEEGEAKSMAELASAATNPVGVPFTSTKIKAYKNWMYVARAIQVLTPDSRRVNPPLFAHVYRYTTKMVEKGGNRWFIPVLGFAYGTAEASRLTPVDRLYQEARSVMAAYNSGAVKASYERTPGDGTPGRADAQPRADRAGSAQAPF